MSQTTPEISEAERVYRRAWRKAFRPDPLTAPRRPPISGPSEPLRKTYAGQQRFLCDFNGLKFCYRFLFRFLFGDLPMTIVNLTQLAEGLNTNVKAIASLVRRYPDFPKLKDRSAGVSYEFELEAVEQWLAENAATKAAEAQQESEWRA